MYVYLQKKNLIEYQKAPDTVHMYLYMQNKCICIIICTVPGTFINTCAFKAFCI